MAALDGIVTPLQRALLAQILDHIDDLDKRIQELDRMAETYMAQFQPAIAEVCQMPGIARRSAEVILAETGIDMSRFPSAAHLCSWAVGSARATTRVPGSGITARHARGIRR